MTDEQIRECLDCPGRIRLDAGEIFAPDDVFGAGDDLEGRLFFLAVLYYVAVSGVAVVAVSYIPIEYLEKIGD